MLHFLKPIKHISKILFMSEQEKNNDSNSSGDIPPKEVQIPVQPSEVYSIISANFELEGRQDITLEEIYRILTGTIRDMLDKNVERLVSILYRIDVGQKKTDEIFNHPSKDDIAALLAEAVIERQLQKVLSRKKYSAGNQ